jgi:tetratricopeptide (TPR) repeat protein
LNIKSTRHYQDAIAVYEEDLEKFPENGWSLYGILKALRMQGKTGKADKIETRFNESWNYAK